MSGGTARSLGRAENALRTMKASIFGEQVSAKNNLEDVNQRFSEKSFSKKYLEYIVMKSGYIDGTSTPTNKREYI